MSNSCYNLKIPPPHYHSKFIGLPNINRTKWRLFHTLWLVAKPFTFKKRKAVRETRGECFHSFLEFSQTLTSATITLSKLGKKVFYFSYKTTAQTENWLCFHGGMANDFQPRSARIVSWLFYKSLCKHFSEEFYFPNALVMNGTKELKFWEEKKR